VVSLHSLHKSKIKAKRDVYSNMAHPRAHEVKRDK